MSLLESGEERYIKAIIIIIIITLKQGHGHQTWHKSVEPKLVQKSLVKQRL